MPREILQLLPELGPHVGVANYARALAAGLHVRELDTLFLAARSAPTEGPERRVVLENRTSRSLADALERAAPSRVIVHYSNYGYATRGCPFWLLAGLGRWRRGRGDRRLITVFHELYATGLPWQSSFWLSPVQRHLARGMSRLSDAAVTSVGRYGETLRHWSPARAVEVMPVFSTAGEMVAPTPLSARSAQMVVFGSAGLRARAYRDVAGAMAGACRGLGIERIVDVGPGDVAPAAVGGVPVETRGFLADQDLAAVLAGSRAGFLAYPAAYLAKSSVFAAYCAFALVPVCSWPGDVPSTGELPLWDAGALASGDDCQRLAQRAHAWYSGHSLARHVEAYGSLLQ